MYRLPLDVEEQLQQQFPDVNIKYLTQVLFQTILNRTIETGSCTISGYGRFLAYKTTRRGKLSPRFKFLFSPNLIKKMRQDQYVCEKLKARDPTIFDSSRSLPEGAVEARQKNIDFQKSIVKAGKEVEEQKRIDNLIRKLSSE